jgi:hypothetical protein
MAGINAIYPKIGKYFISIFFARITNKERVPIHPIKK